MLSFLPALIIKYYYLCILGRRRNILVDLLFLKCVVDGINVWLPSCRLTYWVIFATFMTCEYFISAILFWIPFWYTLKIAVLVWCVFHWSFVFLNSCASYFKRCFSPSTEGANVFYTTILHPFLKSQQNIWEGTLEESEERESKKQS